MVKTELEEGEAPEDYQNFNMDEAFSYLDKKIEDLLGHSQKDFEREFSAENLGARFGGYGSFLPTYQRSPSPWSNPRASSKGQNQSIQKSPLLENSTVSFSETPVKHEPASSCAPPVPVLSTSVDSSVKVLCPTEPVSDHKTIKPPIKQSDQRTLKIRIKVGSDNSTLVKKNAAIYSNLGLDMSPSSSLEDDPAEREGKFQDSRETGAVTPSRIIKIMTSFPVPNGDLLSPLHDSLVHLVDQKKLLDGVYKHTQDVVARNEVASLNEVKQVLGEKNGKPCNANGRLGGMKNEYYKDSSNPVVVHLEKDETLKLPLKSNGRNKVGDTTYGAGKASEADKVGSKDSLISSNIEKEAFRSICFQQASGKKTAETNLAGKVRKEKKGKHGLNSDLGRDDGTKGGKKSDLFEENSGLHKTTQTMDLPKQKFQQKTVSDLDGEIKIRSGMQQLSSGVEKKLKGDRSSTAAGKLKEKVRVSSFAVPKDKIVYGSSSPSKSKGDDRLPKDLWKGKETHNDLIGNTKQGKKESRHDLFGTPYKDKVKDSKLQDSEKESDSFSFKSEKKSGGKVQPKGDPNNATPLTDPLAANVAPVVSLIDWVGCDRCGKWRLLPDGTNPDHLPKKWHCSMINWLPGMNRCSISEDETTNAMHALCQPSISNTQTNQQTYPEKIASGVTLTDAQNFDQNSKVAQKKLVINVPSGARNSDSMCMSNNEKKKPEAHVKSRILPNASQSSLELKSEKISGTAKSLKIKCKREVDEDSLRPSKKARTESMPYGNEEQTPGGLSRKEIRFDNKKYNENSSSKHTRGMAKDGSVPSIGKLKNQVQTTMSMEDHDKMSIPGKKRKIKDWQDSQVYSAEETNETECRKEKKANESKFQVMESNTCEAYGKPDRKAKVNKIILSGNKSNPVDGINVRGEPKSMDRSLGNYDKNKLSQLIVDDKRSSRKDLGKEQSSVAGTSSSSMMSGTCKIKLNLKEVRGSPVESVCSSPLKASNPESLRRSLMNSPTQCLEGDDGRNQLETVGKDSSKKSSLFNHRDGASGRAIHRKVKRQSSKLQGTQSANNCADNYEQNYLHASELRTKALTDGVKNHYYPDDSLPLKYRNRSSLGAKEKNLTPISGSDKGRNKISDSHNEQAGSEHVKYEMENGSHGHTPNIEEGKVGNFKINGNKSNKVEKYHTDLKASTRKCLDDRSRRESQFTFEGNEFMHKKLDTFSQLDEKSTSKQDMQLNCNGKGSLKWLPPDSTNQVEPIEGGLSSNLPAFGDRQENLSLSSQPVLNVEKGGEYYALPLDDFDCGNPVKVVQQLRMADGKTGPPQISSNFLRPNQHRTPGLAALSHIEKDDSSRSANNALQEVKVPKHLADASVSGLESTVLVFEGALKLLHGASLKDPCNSDSFKYGEMASAELYYKAAIQCEYCALEYEKFKDVASASLAYKCMEVAYMRVIYSNDFTASRDREKLQLGLATICPADSPSSSASDVDNLNTHAIVDKMDRAKDVGSPQVTGNLVIAARNRPNFERLLNFVQHVNFAMEAARKSQIAFATASVVLAKAGNQESISPIRRVLDFSFHDVQGLLSLVRLAIDALKS